LNLTANGYFRCYQFNNNASEIATTSQTGYAGSVAVVFGVNTTGELDDPTVRYGIQTTFHQQEITPDVYAETNFSPLTSDSFYTLTRVEDIDLQGHIKGRWTQVASATSLPIETINNMSLVGVSFGYADLNALEITAIVTKTSENYAGEIA
jgi:hypothetical protein